MPGFGFLQHKKTIILATMASALIAHDGHDHSIPKARTSPDNATVSQTPTTEQAQTNPLTVQNFDAALNNIHIGLTAHAAWAGTSGTETDFYELHSGGHGPTETGLSFQQVEVSLGGIINEHLSGLTHFAITEEGVELEEAFMQISRWHNAWSSRLIYFPLELGITNNEHPHDWLWLDRFPTLTRLYGPEAPRGVGGRLGWALPDDSALPTGIMLGIFGNGDDTMTNWQGKGHNHGDDGHDHGPHENSIGDWPQNYSDNDGIVGQWRVEQWPNSDGHRWRYGFSGAIGENSSAPGRFTYLTNAFVRWQHTTWQIDYEISNRYTETPDEDLNDWGTYLATYWRFAPQWQAGALLDYRWGFRHNFNSVDRNSNVDRADALRLSPVVAWTPWSQLRFRAQINVDNNKAYNETITSFLFGIEGTLGSNFHASTW